MGFYRFVQLVNGFLGRPVTCCDFGGGLPFRGGALRNREVHSQTALKAAGTVTKPRGERRGGSSLSRDAGAKVGTGGSVLGRLALTRGLARAAMKAANAIDLKDLNMKYRVFDIIYDGESADVNLPSTMVLGLDADAAPETELADAISDVTGWCVTSFRFEAVAPGPDDGGCRAATRCVARHEKRLPGYRSG